MPAPSSATRRRGAELETALLEAAWLELVEVGYARFRVQSVATRAHTSEPVLYRRWPNKDALVLAGLEHQRMTHPIPSADTGSLRGDLIADLSATGEALADFYVVVSAASVSGLMADTGMSPRDVRERLLGSRVPRIRPLYERAASRGELDLERMPRIVLEMPYDLLRHDLLLDMAAPSASRIRAIVDELFLPLVESAAR